MQKKLNYKRCYISEQLRHKCVYPFYLNVCLNKQTRSNYCKLPTTRKHSLVQTTTAETLVKDSSKTTNFPATVLQTEQCNWVKVFLVGMCGQGRKSIPLLLPLHRQGD
jgi:hypothetical protein